MERTLDVSTPMNSNVKLDLAEDQGEKELEDIIDYEKVVGSLTLDTALATRPDISYVVAALSHYNSWPFTSHMTAANRVLQYLKFTADFQLCFNCINISSTLVGYSDSDWANDSADHKSQRGHISKKYFRPGGMAPSEWTRSVRAVTDTPVADYSAPGVDSRRRVPYRPLIAISPFLLVLSVSYLKRSLWRCG